MLTCLVCLNVDIEEAISLRIARSSEDFFVLEKSDEIVLVAIQLSTLKMRLMIQELSSITKLINTGLYHMCSN